MSKERRRRYDREYKYEAVRVVTEEGRPVAVVARNLGIHANLLYKWKQQYLEDAEYAFPGKRRLKSPDGGKKTLKACLDLTTKP